MATKKQLEALKKARAAKKKKSATTKKKTTKQPVKRTGKLNGTKTKFKIVSFKVQLTAKDPRGGTVKYDIMEHSLKNDFAQFLTNKDFKSYKVTKPK